MLGRTQGWSSRSGTRPSISTARSRPRDAGARHRDALFNGMGPLHHRAPGLAGRGADRAASRAVGHRRLRARAPSGRAARAGRPARRGACHRRGRAPTWPSSPDGTLAGSALTMERCVQNVASLGLPPAQAVRHATANPARVLGLADRGRIAPGARADLVALDPGTLAVREPCGSAGPRLTSARRDRRAVRHVRGRPVLSRNRDGDRARARGGRARRSSSRPRRRAAGSPRSPRVNPTPRHAWPAITSTCSRSLRRGRRAVAVRARRWCGITTPELLPDRRAAVDALAARTFELTRVSRRRARRRRHRRAPRRARSRCTTRATGCATSASGRASARCSTARARPVVEMTEADTCCGFGGVFSLGYPEVSTRLADAKLGHAGETAARYLVSTDLACLMHLDGRRQRLGAGAAADPRRRPARVGTLDERHGTDHDARLRFPRARARTRSATGSCSSALRNLDRRLRTASDSRGRASRVEGPRRGNPARDAARPRRLARPARSARSTARGVRRAPRRHAARRTARSSRHRPSQRRPHGREEQVDGDRGDRPRRRAGRRGHAQRSRPTSASTSCSSRASDRRT